MPSSSAAQNRYIGYLHSNPAAREKAGLSLAKTDEWLKADKDKPWEHRDTGGSVPTSLGQIAPTVSINPADATMNPVHQGSSSQFKQMTPEQLQEYMARKGAPYQNLAQQALQQKMMSPAQVPQQQPLEQLSIGGIPHRMMGGAMGMPGGMQPGMPMGMIPPQAGQQNMIPMMSPMPMTPMRAGGFVRRADGGDFAGGADSVPFVPPAMGLRNAPSPEMTFEEALEKGWKYPLPNASPYDYSVYGKEGPNKGGWGQTEPRVQPDNAPPALNQYLKTLFDSRMKQQNIASGGVAGPHISLPKIGAPVVGAPHLAPPSAPWWTKMQARGMQRPPAVGKFAGGGAAPSVPWWTRNEVRDTQSGDNSGLLHSPFGAAGGRSDTLPHSVAADSYVLPADVVSGMGEGDTLSGARVIDAMLHTEPYGIQSARTHGGMGPPRAPAPPQMQAAGGQTQGSGNKVPVLLANGEYLISPQQVLALGEGNVKRGHQVLEALIKKVRARTIAQLKKLPGPVT